MLPLIPFLILGATRLLFNFFQFEKIKLLAISLIIITVIISFLWGLAFFSIYRTPQTRIIASEWIHNNIPSGSILVGEQGNQILPLFQPQNNPEWHIIWLEVPTNYEPDNVNKVIQIAENLARGDFLVIPNRRIYVSITKNSKEWPLTSRYYQKLFNEELGYKLIKKITSYPRLLNIQINDDKADESFQLYDHPVVYIFQNTEKFSKEKVYEILINQYE